MIRTPALQQLPHTHLEEEAVISGGLVLVLVIFAMVHVHVIKLHQTHQVTGRLEKEKKTVDS